jgi:hypothetical protein
MYFFIIPIHLCLAGWKNWNDFPYICMIFFASLAQSVEQLIRNEQVVGSSPIGGSRDMSVEHRAFSFECREEIYTKAPGDDSRGLTSLHCDVAEIIR